MCHSVRSLRSPVFLSFQFSDVAMRRLAMRPPFWNDLHLRVLAEIADQDDLVDAACHRIVPLRIRGSAVTRIGDSAEMYPAAASASPATLRRELEPSATAVQ